MPESRLTIIGLGTKPRYVLCRCSCGVEKDVWANDVRTGATKSCGCLHSELAAARATKLKRVHGATIGTKVSPEYSVWTHMKGRCSNPNSSGFKRYGARGIKVCERWASFESFLADMGPRPTPKHSIERKDNNGDYEPGNCRWATRQEQSRNTRANHNITHEGRTQCLADWAIEVGLTHSTIRRRLLNGWSVTAALMTPARKVGAA